MPISSITTADTFGLLVTRTSQLITGYNNLEVATPAAFGQANTARIHANNAFANANVTHTLTIEAFSAANSSFANGNINFTVLQTASNVANDGYLQANTARTHANNAFANANSTHTLTIAAFSNANSTHTLTIEAFSAANSSFANGNTNFGVTVAAFAKANAALKNTTDTFTGTLTVTGDIVGKTASNTNTTVIRISTGSEFRAGTSRSTALAPADVFDAAAEVSLTDGSTITIDMSSGFNFNVNLTARATRAISTPTNMKPGQSGYIRIKQGAATAQTASYGAGWAFSGGTSPVFSTGTGNTDILFYQVLSTANVFGSLIKDLRLNY